MQTEFVVGSARLSVHGISPDGSVGKVDIELVDAEDKRWSAIVITLKEVERLMREFEATGEHFNGAYFPGGRHLLIIEEPALDAPRGLLPVIEELLRTGRYRSTLTAKAD